VSGVVCLLPAAEDGRSNDDSGHTEDNADRPPATDLLCGLSVCLSVVCLVANDLLANVAPS